MRKLIIIPAFNEEECIGELLKELREHFEEYDYIVINDKSVDSTEKVLREYGANYISLPVNLGIGGAVQTGYKYALERGYDIAIQLDADGQHSPKYLDVLTDPIEKGVADICIGSRFITREGFQSTYCRRMGIGILSGLVYFCIHKKYWDVTSGYRACSRKYIELYATKYQQDYPEPEAIVSAARSGARIIEIPVEMEARKGGKSSINVAKSFYYMIKVSMSLLLANFER